MALKTHVVVSNVDNLHDARYCAGMGVDMIVFPIDPSIPNYVNPEKCKEIIDWLAGVTIVGESHSTDHLELNQYPINTILINDTQTIPDLKDVDTDIILRIDLDQHNSEQVETILNEYRFSVEFFILNSKQPIDKYKDQLVEWTQTFPVVIGFGIDAENVNEILDEISPKGIELKGGSEIEVGLNTFDGLMEVLEAIDTDEYL